METMTGVVTIGRLRGRLGRVRGVQRARDGGRRRIFNAVSPFDVWFVHPVDADTTFAFNCVQDSCVAL